MVRCPECGQRLYGSEKVNFCVEIDCPMLEQKALSIQLSMEIFTSQKQEQGEEDDEKDKFLGYLRKK